MRGRKGRFPAYRDAALALKVAAASAKMILGRSEDDAALRDAFFQRSTMRRVQTRLESPPPPLAHAHGGSLSYAARYAFLPVAQHTRIPQWVKNCRLIRYLYGSFCQLRTSPRGGNTRSRRPS